MAHGIGKSDTPTSVTELNREPHVNRFYYEVGRSVSEKARASIRESYNKERGGRERERERVEARPSFHPYLVSFCFFPRSLPSSLRPPPASPVLSSPKSVSFALGRRGRRTRTTTTTTAATSMGAAQELWRRSARLAALRSVLPFPSSLSIFRRMLSRQTDRPSSPPPFLRRYFHRIQNSALRFGEPLPNLHYTLK